jgi:hypothetical protein
MSEEWRLFVQLDGCTTWFLLGILTGIIAELAVYVYLRHHARRFRRPDDAND